MLPRVQGGGRTLLAEDFGEAGARVGEVAAYESRCPAALPEAAAAALVAGGVDAITFSSGKTARHTALLLERQFGSEWRARPEGVAVAFHGPPATRAPARGLCRPQAQTHPHPPTTRRPPGHLPASRARPTPHPSPYMPTLPSASHPS